MDISKAALAPRYGYASETDRAHPRFAEYQQHRSAMSRLLVDSADFKDWLACKSAEEYRDEWEKHPRFKEWQSWFIANKMGRFRTLPNGKPSAFPENFKFWLEERV